MRHKPIGPDELKQRIIDASALCAPGAPIYKIKAYSTVTLRTSPMNACPTQTQADVHYVHVKSITSPFVTKVCSRLILLAGGCDADAEGDLASRAARFLCKAWMAASRDLISSVFASITFSMVRSRTS